MGNDAERERPSLKKPRARMLHSRKASNSSLTTRGRSAAAVASAWAMKRAACCCTCLFWAAALAVQRVAIRRPVGLPTDGLQTLLTMSLWCSAVSGDAARRHRLE